VFYKMKFDLKIVAIIPARLASTRLPNKVLLPLGEMSILQRVFKLAIDSSLFDRVIIATDHRDVLDHCNQNNMECLLTSVDHKSGTDRIAEVAKNIEADIIINIQADEPFLESGVLSKLISIMKSEHVEIGTLCKKIKDQAVLFDYNAVKVVKDDNNRALYFSRQAIPAHRDIPYKKWLDNSNYYHHLGIYGFRKDSLLKITQLPEHPLEQSEKLEQLRWMGNGHAIHIIEVSSNSFGIDSEADYQRAIKHLEK